MRARAPLLRAPSEKSRQSLPLPGLWPRSELPPACDPAFLSLARRPGWSLRAPRIPAVRSHAASPREGRS
uniref:Uncharacterized protein n=1 Tax=Mustela putorius furo TaxID=9669 RepID=M3YW26_MUSPF